MAHNIRVTLVEPGAVDTELAGHNRDEVLDQIKQRFEGVKRLEAEDIARAVLYAIGQPDHVAINEVLVRPPTSSARSARRPPRGRSGRPSAARRPGVARHDAAPPGAVDHLERKGSSAPAIRSTSAAGSGIRFG